MHIYTDDVREDDPPRRRDIGRKAARTGSMRGSEAYEEERTTSEDSKLEDSESLLPVTSKESKQEGSQRLLPVTSEESQQEGSQRLLSVTSEDNKQEGSKRLLPVTSEDSQKEGSQRLQPAELLPVLNNGSSGDRVRSNSYPRQGQMIGLGLPKKKNLAPPLYKNFNFLINPVGNPQLHHNSLPHSRRRSIFERTDKVLVYVRLVFLKLGEIDTGKECFSADVFVQAKWREPLVDEFRNTANQTPRPIEICRDDYWNPKLYIDNSVSELKEHVWMTVIHNESGEGFLCERRRIRGTFLENMELKEFPFDTQDITVVVSSERTLSEIELEEDCREVSSINVHSFVDEQEWKLHKYVLTHKDSVSKVFAGSGGGVLRHPFIASRCLASRRFGFYIWNIMLVRFVISSLAFATFAVPPTDNSYYRLSLTFLLLLTAVTFKFAVNQILPKISYLTYLDYYILASLGMHCAIVVWHAIIIKMPYTVEIPFNNNPNSTYAERESQEMSAAHVMRERYIIDRYALIGFSSVYIVAHVILISVAYYIVSMKRKLYRKLEMEHQVKMSHLQLQLEEIV